MDRHTLPNRQELVTRAQTPQSLLRELFSARSRFRCQSPSQGSLLPDMSPFRVIVLTIRPLA
jgi:hypothetical protein